MLELVASTPHSASTSTSLIDAASSFITGVPAPTSTGPYLTGVPAPVTTGTNNPSSTRGSPRQSEYPGTGAQVVVKGALMGIAFGALALVY